jgi:hypothetical protein
VRVGDEEMSAVGAVTGTVAPVSSSYAEYVVIPNAFVAPRTHDRLIADTQVQELLVKVYVCVVPVSIARAVAV